MSKATTTNGTAKATANGKAKKAQASQAVFLVTVDLTPGLTKTAARDRALSKLQDEFGAVVKVRPAPKKEGLAK